MGHLDHGVYGAFQLPDVAGYSVGVDCHVDDSGMNGNQVADAKRFGDHCHVGAEAGFHQEMGPNAALGLAHNAGDYQVALQSDARLADSFSSHDNAGQAALHVLNAVAVEMVSFDHGDPWVPDPAAGEGVDVGVAVQHQTLAAAGAFQYSDGLETPGFHFLQVYLVAALVEKVGQEVGHRGFFEFETGNFYQFASEVDDSVFIDLGNDFRLCRVHVSGPTPSLRISL